MTHFYPQGALQTPEQVLALADETVYFVYGLGSDSSIVEEHISEEQNGVQTSELGFNYVNYDYYLYDDRAPKRKKLFLGDRNITAHHNEHYIFARRADAEAYLAWAKTNTSYRGGLR